MARILLVDDELTILQLMQKVFTKEGYDVTVAHDGTEAVKILEYETFDLLLTDIRMKEMGGMELLKVAHALRPGLTVVMMTAYAAVDTAVESMKNGAFDYICKPFKIDEILLTVKRALEYSTIKKENKILKDTLEKKYHYDKLIGESSSMLKVYSMIGKLSRTECPALIEGATGTGKDLLARAIHFSSERKLKPFTTFNCSTFSGRVLEEKFFGSYETVGATTVLKPGALEAATDGTLYLDEVDALPIDLQIKLTTAIKEGFYAPLGEGEKLKLNARILASSVKDIQSLVDQGSFKEELYYDLSVVLLELPCLQHRIDDLPLLVKHFIDDFNNVNKREVKVAMNAIRAMSDYDWPGNVRELEGVIKRAAVLSDNDLITLQDLPEKVATAGGTVMQEISSYRGYSLKKFLREKEKEYIDHVLNMAGGDKEKSAEILGVSLATFYRKYNDSDQ